MLVDLSSNKVKRLTQRSRFTRLDRLTLQFSSSHVNFDVWPGPCTQLFSAFYLSIIILHGPLQSRTKPVETKIYQSRSRPTAMRKRQAQPRNVFSCPVPSMLSFVFWKILRWNHSLTKQKRARKSRQEECEYLISVRLARCLNSFVRDCRNYHLETTTSDEGSQLKIFIKFIGKNIFKHIDELEVTLFPWSPVSPCFPFSPLSP